MFSDDLVHIDGKVLEVRRLGPHKGRLRRSHPTGSDDVFPVLVDLLVLRFGGLVFHLSFEVVDEHRERLDFGCSIEFQIILPVFARRR